MVGTMFGYTVQISTKAWTALVVSARMGPLSKMVVPYVMFNPTPNSFEMISRREALFAPKLHANAFGEASGPVWEK